MNIIYIYINLSTFKPLWKRFWISNQCIFIIFQHWNISCNFLLSCWFNHSNIFFLIKCSAFHFCFNSWIIYNTCFIFYKVFIPMFHYHHIIFVWNNILLIFFFLISIFIDILYIYKNCSSVLINYTLLFDILVKVFKLPLFFFFHHFTFFFKS